MTSSACDVEVAIIGAGVVGLAIGAELAGAGRGVMLIERHPGPGRETSSRNSEVIHAGLYYPRESLKARLCVEGRHLLYELCASAGIGHRRLGKLLVACGDEELPELERLYAQGSENGVENLRLLDRTDLARLEPSLRAGAALHSPETGIVDSHGLIKALEARLRAAAGLILYRCELRAVDPSPSCFELRLRNPAGEETIKARWLINAAGLEADTVAALAGIADYPLHWCKGDYFSVSGPARRAVSHLVYPVPQRHALGIHITLDLGGRMRLGPDATYIDRSLGQQPHLTVDEAKGDFFTAAVKRYLPLLTPEQLQPDQTGIRPKLQGPGDPFRDFVIRSEAARGLPRLINLAGIDSPGLTSCLAIGKLAHQILTSLAE